MSSLTVNLDSFAVLRTITGQNEPDPSRLSVLAEINGADGIAVQYRRDKKYIKDKDLYLLKGISRSKFIIEMPPTDETVALALQIKPWMVLFVADYVDNNSPVSPIDFRHSAIDFRNMTSQLEGVGIKTGFLVDSEADSVKSAAKNSASAVLINCREYTRARNLDDARAELEKLERAFQTASKLGLEIFAGGDLDYKNIKPLLDMNIVDEFFVGNSLCARAAMVGIGQAVKEMAEVIQKS